MRFPRLIPALLMTLVLSACADDKRLLDSDPGVYDGKTDPLTQKGAADRAQALQKRFKLVQDRQ